MKLTSLLTLLLPAGLLAQQTDTVAMRFAGLVTADGMKKNLTVLASDEYEGRETGEKGQKMSAEYIKNYYKELGIPALKQLPDGYEQSYPLAVYKPQVMDIGMGKKQYEYKTDFFSFANTIGDTTFDIPELVFCGYGINTLKYNDFEGNNVKDKAIVILPGEPLLPDGRYFLTESNEESSWSSYYRTKMIEAQKQGVKFLFIVENNMERAYQKYEHKVTSSRMSIDKNEEISFPVVIYISAKMADDILSSSKKTVEQGKTDIDKSLKPLHFSAKTDLHINILQKHKAITAENVMAYIEGSDKKDEVIVISAHYDHLGKHNGIVYNGADDDGSGTVAVMQLAKAFAEAKKQGKGPRRSILFLNVSGEEKGLLGSDYYSQNPVFPLAQTVCDLNIDMIGRLDADHKNNPNYIYLIGSDKLSSELHSISENANKTYTKLELDYKYNDEKDPNRFYYRSDHYNFAKNNVPVIFYFNGTHEDYHEETDEVQKIDFSKMEKISRLVFYTAWDIANRPSRIKVDNNKK